MNVVRRHDMTDMDMSPPPMAGMNDTMHDHMQDSEMAMSHMTFFWGKNSEILFSGWPGTSSGLYVLALIIVFVVSVFLEWLSHSPLMTRNGPRNVAAGIVQTTVHAIRVGLAYLVMLALMSFNGGVFIVAILGHAVGFLVFGSRVFRKTEVLRPYDGAVASNLTPPKPTSIC